jgi:hypothetical protein
MASLASAEVGLAGALRGTERRSYCLVPANGDRPAAARLNRSYRW